MAEIKNIQLPNGATYTFVDEVARAAATAGFKIVKVDVLPTASKETTGGLYLVPNSSSVSQNSYDEYVTITNDDVNYSWEKIGTTDIDLSTETDDFVKSYPGTTSQLVKTKVPNVTGNDTVTATKTVFGSNVKASKASSGTTTTLAEAGTPVSVPNVTSAGNASTWNFEVSGATLIISGANSVAPTIADTPISITPAKSKSITTYTFSDVDVPVVSSNEDVTATNTTLGTAIDVATGSVSTSGKGASVLIGLGTATTAKAITKIGK